MNDELMDKYLGEFWDYYMAMCCEMSSYDEEKGDSWKESEIRPSRYYLEHKLKAAFDEYMSHTTDKSLIKLGNYAAMLYLRRKKGLL